jgi:DNA-binding MarR family transcriptional regulator
MASNEPAHRPRTVRSPLPPTLTDSTGFLLGWVASHASEAFATALTEVGLTAHQLGVMTLLVGGPQKQARLSEQLEVFQPVMVTLVNELEAAGLVRRQPHPTDRRAVEVHLEPAGAERLARADTAMAAATEQIFGGLPDADRDTLHRILLQLTHQLDARATPPRQET